MDNLNQKTFSFSSIVDICEINGDRVSPISNIKKPCQNKICVAIFYKGKSVIGYDGDRICTLRPGIKDWDIMGEWEQCHKKTKSELDEVINGIF